MDVLFRLTVLELILVAHFSPVPRALMQIVIYLVEGGCCHQPLWGIYPPSLGTRELVTPWPMKAGG